MKTKGRDVLVYKDSKLLRSFLNFEDCLEWLKTRIDDCRPIVYKNKLIFVNGERCNSRYIVSGKIEDYKKYFKEKIK